jgi:hypothetical protein
MIDLDIGSVVRDRAWGGRFTGTVVRREGTSVFVAWHDSCVEDELEVDQVEPWPDAPAELAAWRGGLGVIGGEEGYDVEPSSS